MAQHNFEKPGLNEFGPLTERLTPPDEWIEITNYDEYFYFRKGNYYYVSSVPAPRPGYTWVEVGDDYYMVKVSPITIESFTRTPLCETLYKIIQECDPEIHPDSDDFSNENPVFVKDVFHIMSKNHDIMLSAISNVAQKINQWYDHGKLDPEQFQSDLAALNVRLGLDTTPFVELFKASDTKCSFVGPVAVSLSPKTLWDAVETANGQFYYFRKGHYDCVEDPTIHFISHTHWIHLMRHKSVCVNEKCYIILETEATKDIDPESELFHDSDASLADGENPNCKMS